MRESAQWRVRAADIVDLITGRLSTNGEEDWATLEDYLSLCHRSLQLALAS
ncbi:MAG TPA: hypothetical protein VKV40_07135 [Ktedonobacteraceae bacterium]|nr:hypothetical protein [Ktedonobacteraceae bacterium]